MEGALKDKLNVKREDWQWAPERLFGIWGRQHETT